MKHSRGRWRQILNALVKPGQRVAVLAVTATALLAIGASQAAADTTIYPTLDCVVNSGSDGSGGTLYTAYFGYVNAGSDSFNYSVGDDNDIIPGPGGFDGQPTTFNPGSYPSVVAAQFDTSFASSVEWVLNGSIATATSSSPQCVAASTGSASALTTTSATLEGQVDSLGAETTYYFEFGPSPSSLQGTPTQTLTSDDPQLVTTNLTGLKPSTTYYYELVADNGRVSTTGTELSFTTPAAPVTVTPTSPTAAVSLSGSVSADAYTPGRALLYALTAANSGPVAAANVAVQVALPAHVKLASDPGCSGTTLVTCNLGTLAAGAKVAVSISVIPAAKTTGPLQTVAVVTTSTANTDTTGDVVTLSTAAPSAHCGSVKPRQKRHEHHRRSARRVKHDRHGHRSRH